MLVGYWLKIEDQGGGTFRGFLDAGELLVMGRMSQIIVCSCIDCLWLVVLLMLVVFFNGGILVHPPSVEGPEMRWLIVHMLVSSTSSSKSVQCLFLVDRMRLV